MYLLGIYITFCDCKSRHNIVLKDGNINNVDERYITLWLHHRNMWFKEDAGNHRLQNFLKSVKDSGFTSLMTDIPWAWTERGREEFYEWEAFGKDFYGEVCAAGLGLHFVINMREFPPWVKISDSITEKVSGTVST